MLLFSVVFQKFTQNATRILGQGVAAAADAPVVHHASLHDGVRLADLVYRNIITQVALCAAILNDGTDDFIIRSVLIQEIAVAFVQELGGEKPGQQIHGNGVLDHNEELVIEEHQLVDEVAGRIQAGLQLIIFLIENEGQGAKERILAFKIMVE